MKYILITVLIFSLLSASSCSIKKYPTYNESYYTFKVFKKNEKRNKTADIQLLFYDSNENQLINHPTWIKRSCDKLYLEKGKIEYNFKYDETPETPISFKIDAFGYSSIETRPIKIESKDSIVFKFYLAEPKTPIIDL